MSFPTLLHLFSLLFFPSLTFISSSCLTTHPLSHFLILFSRLLLACPRVFPCSFISSSLSIHALSLVSLSLSFPSSYFPTLVSLSLLALSPLSSLSSAFHHLSRLSAAASHFPWYLASTYHAVSANYTHESSPQGRVVCRWHPFAWEHDSCSGSCRATAFKEEVVVVVVVLLVCLVLVENVPLVLSGA